MILQTSRSRIIFGLSLLLVASAGLGALSSQFDAGNEAREDLPAMRAPVQQKNQPHQSPAPGKAVTPRQTEAPKATGAA